MGSKSCFLVIVILALSFSIGFGQMPPGLREETAGPGSFTARENEGGPVPGNLAKISTMEPEEGWIERWLTHYKAIPGFFGNDLIGEDSVTSVCEGQNIGPADGAPSVWWYGAWDGKFGTSRYQAAWDDDACASIDENLVRYFFTKVLSDTDVEALLSIGHDDSLKVWLNGAAVYQGVDGTWEADSHQVAVQLEAGWNTILLKQYYPELSEDSGTRYFSLRFFQRDGEKPLMLTQSADGWCSKEEGRNWIYAGGVAELPGALGSVWSSDLRVTNPLPYRTLVTIEYFREGRARPGKAVGPEATVDLVLEPFESRTWEGVLPTLFGLEEYQKGMLAIRGFEDGTAQRGVLELRTYNRSGSGTFGTEIPFFGVWDGSTCCSQVLLGLRNGSRFRTNLAGFPTVVMDTETIVTITLWDMDSERQEQRVYTVKGYFQVNDVFAALGMANVETNDGAAMISWSSSDTGSRWNFTASVNDNVTSDPSFVRESVWMPFP